VGFVTDCNGLAKPLDFWPKTVYSIYMKNETTFQANLLDTSYNGWTNYETWNIALWIGNDESLYSAKCEVECYEDLLELIWEAGSKETPDGVKWTSSKVNRAELNSNLWED